MSNDKLDRWIGTLDVYRKQCDVWKARIVSIIAVDLREDNESLRHMLNVACADLDAARAEVEALKHDIDRHVQIAREQAEEVERLCALLRWVHNSDGVVWSVQKRIRESL
jgi:diphthamide synthase (EF-2-diphthine--ammonia ligase)